jgi:ATP-dependent Clp protease ATP-binding subunit ClpB
MNTIMVENILKIQMKTLYTALEKQGISLTISKEASALMAQMGFTPKYGARPLTTVIRSQLRRPLSRKIISGEIGPGSSVSLDTGQNNELVWKIENK